MMRLTQLEMKKLVQNYMMWYKEYSFECRSDLDLRDQLMAAHRVSMMHSLSILSVHKDDMENV
ncbi:MAG: hypothetical protein WCY09_09810, partial [Candidatus Omnitrophota bacterium]